MSSSSGGDAELKQQQQQQQEQQCPLPWASPLPDLLQGPVGVGAQAVQLVDEGEEGHVVSLHLPADRHRLTLNPAHRTQHQHSPVQHPQGSLHLDGEVHVAWDQRCGGWLLKTR